jgi:hypothetical protein
MKQTIFTKPDDDNFSPEQLPESAEELQGALDNLTDDGYIYALCPSCRIPLSTKERQDLQCSICKNDFKLKDILYIYNDSPS